MKKKSNHFKKGCPDKSMFFLVSSDEASLEDKERFINHLLLCQKCKKKFEMINQLSQELNKHLKNIPDESLSLEEKRQLKKTARQKIKALRKSKKTLVFGLIPVPYFVSAALILTTILGLVFIPKIQHRGEFRKGDETKPVLIEPLGKIDQTPSVFSWSPVRSADNYVFKLIDENLDILYKKGIQTTQIILPENIRVQIQKEKTYIWKVTALDEDSRVLDSSSNYFKIK